MRMNGDELFEAFEKDYETPIQEDPGAHIAQVMEAKLTQMMDKYEKKLQELTDQVNGLKPEAAAPIPEEPEAAAPDPIGEEGGEDV